MHSATTQAAITATATRPPTDTTDLVLPLLMLGVGLLCTRSKRSAVWIVGCFMVLAAIFTILQL